MGVNLAQVYTEMMCDRIFASCVCCAVSTCTRDDVTESVCTGHRTISAAIMVDIAVRDRTVTNL